jgi:hypothetical protein
MKQYTKYYEHTSANVNIGNKTHTLATTTSQARTASARFSLGVHLDTHISHNQEEPHPDEQPLPLPETYEQLDQFIDQCIHEWAIWLINTELRHSQLQYKHRRPYTITDWQKLLPQTALHHKEATTTS